MNLIAHLFSTAVPRAPDMGASHVWMHLGWSVVLVWLLLALASRRGMNRKSQWVLAVCVAVWTWLPSTYSPSHWLGLAFQAPSISLVLLCGCSLDALYRRGRSLAVQLQAIPLALVAAGILLGWVLLLDTFAVLPMAVYPWGFSPAALGLLFVAVLLPWVVFGGGPSAARSALLMTVVVLTYAVLGLPSGNLWDAILDPWLWLALHLVLVRRWRSR